MELYSYQIVVSNQKCKNTKNKFIVGRNKISLKLSCNVALPSMSLPRSSSLFKYCEQIKSRITMAKAALNKKKTLFTSIL